MKLAIISDIHSNIEFFKKCLKAIERFKVDKIICLGDIIGYFPFDKSIFDLIKKYKIYTLLGNHEAMLFKENFTSIKKDKIYRLEETKLQFSKKRMNQILSLKPFYEFDDKLLFIHGSPWDPLNGYIYPESNFDIFDGFKYEAIFMGHTHRPFIKRLKNKIIINPGSCGLPRDQGNMPSFCIFDSVNLNADIYRVRIDIKEFLTYNEGLDNIIVDCLKRNSKDIIGMEVTDG